MTQLTIPPEVEETVGNWVAIAAILRIMGHNEMLADGHIADDTRETAGEVLTRLALLRLDGYPPDELKHAAYLHAPETIKRCCEALSDKNIRELIDSVIDTIDHVIKRQAH